jgi:hypothetical protein
MTVAFALGNGVSRKIIDLTRINPLGPIYGCNALYREFEPDVLVATDRPIAQRIQESGYSKKHRFYTRRPLNNLGALPIPKKYHGNSSGPIIVAIAALDGHRRIYMLGFDMGPIGTDKFNNIYADTEFYKSAQSVPTYTGNWVRQLIQVAKDFPTVEFVRVVGATTATIPDFSKQQNIVHLPMQDFVHRINTQEDL